MFGVQRIASMRQPLLEMLCWGEPHPLQTQGCSLDAERGTKNAKEMLRGSRDQPLSQSHQATHIHGRFCTGETQQRGFVNVLQIWAEVGGFIRGLAQNLTQPLKISLMQLKCR